MIGRRIVLAVVLTVLAAGTIGVILGLDEDTRSNLATQLPDGNPVTSPSPKQSSSASATGSASAKPPTKSSSSSSSKPTSTASHAPTSSATKPTATASASAASPTTSKPVKKSSTTKPKKSKKVVYLSFDDGPSMYTPQVLKVLRATGSTATFFQLGVNRPGHAKTIAAIKAQGSNIGNHSYNHPDLTRLSNAGVQSQLRGGPKAKCFRPPYGATNARVRQLINAAGMRQVLWTVDTNDWRKPGVYALQRFGKSPLVKNKGIILMHDGGGTREQTVAALPKLIKDLQARGFTVEAIPYC